MGKPRVFLDSSVIIAALLSNSGASYYLLTALYDKFEFMTNQYVLIELEELLRGKFSSNADLQNTLFLLFGVAHIKVISSPVKKEINKLSKVISKKDTPILAGALANADYLLTLDNEFLTNGVSKYAMKYKLKILKPGNFVKSI